MTAPDRMSGNVWKVFVNTATRSDGLERSESNYFCTVINKILVKENIFFYIMANLAAS